MARTGLAVTIVLAVAWLAPAQGPVGIGDGPHGIGGLRPAMASGMTAQTPQTAPKDGAVEALGVEFAKTGPERRLLAFEGRPAGGLGWALTVGLRCRITVEGEAVVRPAVILWDKDGGAWYKVGGQPLEANGFADVSLPLSSLQQATFSEDASGRLEADAVERVWVGIVIDGAGKGSFALSRAQFSAEAYRPSQPLRFLFDDPKQWPVAKDGAIQQAELTTPEEGPQGQRCMKFEFTFPTGRHMYALPALDAPRGEVEGYRALQLTLKAKPPQGIGKVLISIFERDGSQYVVEPVVSGEWETMTLPFEEFRLGGWSKDENDQLDVGQLYRVSVGCHGTAQGDGKGLILVCDIAFVP